MKVKLNNVRLAFPKLFKAEQVNGQGEPKFSAAFLLAPNHPAVASLKAAFDEVGKAKWGDKWTTVKKTLEAGDKLALHNGDTKADLDGYEGNLFINANTKTRPLVIDRNRTPLTQEDGKPYAGCYVNASVELWAQENEFGKRINASLRGVQFYGDGDAFAGGGTADADEFEDLAVTDDAADLV